MDLKIIICGVGGQGVLYFAKNLYALAVMNDCRVMGSETHGMSQRGGSVVSHVKIGEYSSPMVQRGTADFLFSLKAEETYPHLGFLRRGGRLVINCGDAYHIDDNISRALSERDVTVDTYDATGRAVALGAPPAANLILLSFAVSRGILPFSIDQLKEAVRKVTAPARLDVGLKAVEAGMAMNSEA